MQNYFETKKEGKMDPGMTQIITKYPCQMAGYMYYRIAFINYSTVKASSLSMMLPSLAAAT